MCLVTADVMQVLAGAGALVAQTGSADAAVLLEDADGDAFTAYEAPFSIRVAASQDAVSSGDVDAFRRDHSKYAGLQLAQKKTLNVRFCVVSPRVSTVLSPATHCDAAQKMTLLVRTESCGIVAT